MKGSTKIIIGIAAFYIYVNNYSLTVETINQNINQSLNLPVQIPLKDLIFNTRQTPAGFIRVFVSKTNSQRLLF